jgi:hypothetical protein
MSPSRTTGNSGTNNRSTDNGPSPRPTPIESFRGRCDSLPSTAIYDCSVHNQADLYAQTNKEIAIYAGSKLTCGNDTKLSLESMAKVKLVKPKDPPDDAGKTDLKIWESQCINYAKRSNHLEENLKTVYTIVYGQCTELLKTRLQSLPKFEVARVSGDVISLLRMIKEVFSLDGDKYAPMAVFQAIRKLCTIKQQKYSLHAFVEHFNNQLDVLHQCGGTLTMPGVTISSAASEEVDLATCTPEKKKCVLRKAEQRVAAVMFLSAVNQKQFGHVLEQLHNAYIQGTDSYPADVSAAYHLLSHWQQHDSQRDTSVETVSGGVAFFQSAMADEDPADGTGVFYF